MLDEKFARNQIFIQHVLLNRFNISSNTACHFVMLDEMLNRFNKAFRKFLNIHKKKKSR